MKMKIKLLLVLFNLLVLSGYGQVQLVTTLDTVEVEALVVNKIGNEMKKIIDGHLDHIKKESFCINKKNNIMIVNVSKFDTTLPYYNLIDYTGNDTKYKKYVFSIYTVRKNSNRIYCLNYISERHFYYKYKGWDIYISTKTDIKFQNKGKIKYTIFPLEYKEFNLDDNGQFSLDYLEKIIDHRGYEDINTSYKLNERL